MWKRSSTGLHPESVNDLPQAACVRDELAGGPYSAHSLRAGFVTYAHLHGATDRAIAHQTRHPFLGRARQRVHRGRGTGRRRSARPAGGR